LYARTKRDAAILARVVRGPYVAERRAQSGTSAQRSVRAARTDTRPAGSGRSGWFSASSVIAPASVWFASASCSACSQSHETTWGSRETLQEGAAAAAKRVYERGLRWVAECTEREMGDIRRGE